MAPSMAHFTSSTDWLHFYHVLVESVIDWRVSETVVHIYHEFGETVVYGNFSSSGQNVVKIIFCLY